VRGHRDLERVVWAAVLCAAAALLLPFSGISLVFAVPLALFLPGYAIVAATFAKRDLSPPYFLVLSVALSLSTLALGALVLDYMPGGIRAASWTILLLLIVVGCCRLAALRRARGHPGPSVTLPRPGRTGAALLLAGLALTVASVVLANTSLPADDAVGYTQLWILPQAEAGTAAFEVGVASEEQRRGGYDMRINVGDERVVRRSFALRPGETKLVRVREPSLAAGRSAPVVATLVRHNRPFNVYRRVKTWITAPEAAP
jgi:hypothetical protein